MRVSRAGSTYVGSPLLQEACWTALKQDLHCSSAELVYSTTLSLPGEFFDPSHSVSTSDPAGYVTKLRDFMQQLRWMDCGCGYLGGDTLDCKLCEGINKVAVGHVDQEIVV